MKIHNPFAKLSRTEFILWLISLGLVSGSFFLCGSGSFLTLTASLIGATALIFVSKGEPIGQVLTVVFGIIYAVISFGFGYYGEVVTYVGMTAPIAAASAISWIRHPHREGASEVRISRLDRKRIVLMFILTAVVTFIFYFILKAFGTANLTFSTISVATSFAASYLMLMRSPLYAVAYASNDVVIIILWIMASLENPSYIPMTVCFLVFLINDLYGFYNWRRISKRQTRELTE